MEKYKGWHHEEDVGNFWWDWHLLDALPSWILTGDCGYGSTWQTVSALFWLILTSTECQVSAKYPLVCMEKLMDVFGEDLSSGFDIGCKFKTTLKNSPLGACAQALCHTCLVGAFHGHAHRRLCQLDHLAIYVKGLGLEDLEGCEHAFSKSNALASSCVMLAAFTENKPL